MTEKLVVVIMGQNVEKFVGMALESVKDANGIVYCDGGSSDGTQKKVISFKDVKEDTYFIYNEYDQQDVGMNGKQRNFYLNYVKKHYPNHWCLAIDADEVVEDLSKIKEFIQTAPKGLYDVKMRHLIGDLAHEDATVDTHWVPKRLFKIECADKYPEFEHSVLQGKKESIEAMSLGGTDCTTIWHLAYIPNLWDYKKKYDNHMKKSNMHTPEFLKQWYFGHMFGTYPKTEFNPVELPEVILNEFGIEKDELYFQHRGIELKHFLDAIHWKDHFKCKTAVEFGCGKGPRVFALNQVGVETKGFEISEYAVNNRFDSRVEQADLTDTYIGNSQFDLTIAYDVLEHIEEEKLDRAIKNLIAFSKKHILISVPVIGDPNLDNDPTHKIRKTKESWIKLFTDKGLKHVETPHNFLYNHQVFIFEK